jgi:hypothetical protein
MKFVNSRLVWVAVNLIVLMMPIGRLFGATIQVTNLSPANIQAAINSSTNGDTVVLPRGTAVWNTLVTIDRPITLQGAGIDQTIIVNAQSVDLVTLTGGEVIDIVAKSNGVTRVTGLTFNGTQFGGSIDCDGELFAAMRIDHCKIINSRREGVKISALVSGLIDHCTFVNNFLHVGDYPDRHMTTSWQTPLTLGTTNCLVIEDCTFAYADTGSWDPWGGKFWSSFENGRGARLTFRYNRWTNYDDSLAISPIMDAHGNQEPVNLINNTGPHRGARSLEVYGNIFDNHVSPTYTRYCRNSYLRGGTLVIHDNVMVGKQMDTTFFCQEEDGPSRFNFLTNYPGYDQHWMWMWNNVANGTPITQLSYVDPSDAIFLLAGTNVFWSPKPDYKALAYPHPLTQLGIPPPSRPPTVFATATAQPGSAPVNVTFSSAGSASWNGVVLTYFWTFGDGGFSSEVNPVHTYQTNGTYSAQLFVSDGLTTASSKVRVKVPGP